MQAGKTFLGIWIRLLVEGKPFEVWDGEQLRDFTYVDDAVEAMLLVANSDAAAGKAFNLGGDCVISLKGLAELLVDANGSGEFAVRSFPVDRKRIDIGDYYADFGAIRAAVGWEPKVALRDGLDRAIRYYREHLPHYL